jgi:DNA repair exonuclease SbcCD ATPase subunit
MPQVKRFHRKANAGYDQKLQNKKRRRQQRLQNISHEMQRLGIEIDERPNFEESLLRAFQAGQELESRRQMLENLRQEIQQHQNKIAAIILHGKKIKKKIRKKSELAEFKNSFQTKINLIFSYLQFRNCPWAKLTKGMWTKGLSVRPAWKHSVWTKRWPN